MLSVERTGRSCPRRAGEGLPGRKAKAPGGKKLERMEQSDDGEGGARLLAASGWGRGLRLGGQGQEPALFYVGFCKKRRGALGQGNEGV